MQREEAETRLGTSAHHFDAALEAYYKRTQFIEPQRRRHAVAAHELLDL